MLAGIHGAVAGHWNRGGWAAVLHQLADPGHRHIGGIIMSTSVSADAFARIKFPGRSVFFGMMIATLLLPFHVVIIPQDIVFQQLWPGGHERAAATTSSRQSQRSHNQLPRA